MKLLILESGAKARTIKKYLGKGWMVEACNGHVQDLPSRGSTKDSSKAMWASKSGELPSPPWSWTEKAERVMSKIANKASNADVKSIFIATDPDREGEFIAWRLSEILSDFDEVNRVSFNEITKDAVLEAISKPRDLDMSLVDAAIVRRLMDRLVGFRCSKFCRSWKLRSMGRVQTPTLGYIVDKELDREAHVPIEFHSVSVITNNIEAKVRFHESDDPNAWTDGDGKHFPDRTSNSGNANSVLSQLNSERKLILESIKEGTVNRKPQPPFTTDTMLQSASSILGWSISKTSSISSALYQSGHITYIRTDSTRTNATAREEIRRHIEGRFGQNFLGEGIGESGKKNSGTVQDAHEAIRPTKPSVENISANPEESRLYKLIWSRFAASQMSNSIRERRSLTFSCEGVSEEVYATSSWRTHSGWEEVFDWANKEAIIRPPSIGLNIGDTWGIDQDAEITTDFTKPPRRFTESSIIQQMKKDGIGRPSTYVSTVTKLLDRGYLEKDGGSLIPTVDGRTLWLDVAPYYNHSEVYGDGIFSYKFTSNMESNLDFIENGQVEASTKWEEFVEIFRNTHNIALEKRREKPTIRQMQYLERLMLKMPESDKNSILQGREITELSGQETKEIIDNLAETNQAIIPASEKQLALIIRLVDKLNLDLSKLLSDIGISDISDLTGGREGNASELIGNLIDLDRESPATEKQKEAITSMSEKLEISIEQAIELVMAESFDKITKSEASGLISSLKKTISNNRRKRK